MVLRLGGDGSCVTALLQSAQDVRIAFLTRDGPVAGAVLRVALVRGITPLLRVGGIVRAYLRQQVDVGHLPCRRPVGDEGVTQKDDWGKMFERYFGGHVSRVETVGGTRSSDDRHRALTVATIEGLQQVGLLALRGHAGRRAAALHVDDDQRQLVDDG